VEDKLALFPRDMFDPISFLEVALNAGLDQASSRDPTCGQGAAGYGKRLGADFAGQTTRRFFTDFAYPMIFSEDPRYYRLIHGSGTRRFFHAVQHTFVARRDSGKRMFNVSQLLGTATVVAASDVRTALDARVSCGRILPDRPIPDCTLPSSLVSSGNDASD